MPREIEIDGQTVTVYTADEVAEQTTRLVDTHAAEALAAQLGIKDTNLALGLVDWSKVTRGEDGKPANLKEVLTGIQARISQAVEQRAGPPPATAPVINPDRRTTQAAVPMDAFGLIAMGLEDHD